MNQQYLDEVMSRISDGALITIIIALVIGLIVALFRGNPSSEAKQSKAMPCPMCGQEVKS